MNFHLKMWIRKNNGSDQKSNENQNIWIRIQREKNLIIRSLLAAFLERLSENGASKSNICVGVRGPGSVAISITKRSAYNRNLL